MGFAERTCVTVACDGNCQHSGWSEDGPWHFDSRERAVEWCRDHGWLITDTRVLCDDCTKRAECAATGHQYGNRWSPMERSGVTWRERYCDHCDETDYDPPLAELRVLSDAARVLESVDLNADGDQP